MLTYPIDKEEIDKDYSSIQLYRRFTSWKEDDIYDFHLNNIYKMKKEMMLTLEPSPLKEKVRLYIFSNKAIQVKNSRGEIEPFTYQLAKDSYFKLIGRPDYLTKGSLILLNIDKARIEEFKKDTSIIDTMLINYATSEFEADCTTRHKKIQLSAIYSNSVCPPFEDPDLK